jgi:CTP:molybdopterin cytidylyltransferase MocA
MTVAAVVLVPDSADALLDADGEPALRRIVQSAWAGGALPIVAVGHGLANPAGPVAAALAGLPATIADPEATPGPGMPWFLCGLTAATASVNETAAALLWPIRYTWVDPETVTSLIEAHGAAEEAIIQPASSGQAGFPILFPVSLRDRLAATSALHAPEAVAELSALGVKVVTIQLGDPGIVTDVGTPRAHLPNYQGPPERPTRTPEPPESAD